MIEDTRYIFEDCNCDLEEDSKKDREVAKVPILAIRTTPGTGSTPVRTRETTNKHPGEP